MCHTLLSSLHFTFHSSSFAFPSPQTCSNGNHDSLGHRQTCPGPREGTPTHCWCHQVASAFWCVCLQFYVPPFPACPHHSCQWKKVHFEGLYVRKFCYDYLITKLMSCIIEYFVIMNLGKLSLYSIMGTRDSCRQCKARVCLYLGKLILLLLAVICINTLLPQRSTLFIHKY